MQVAFKLCLGPRFVSGYDRCGSSRYKSGRAYQFPAISHSIYFLLFCFLIRSSSFLASISVGNVLDAFKI